MPIQVLPNGKILQLNDNGSTQFSSPGVSTGDLLSMLFQPQVSDPRSGAFGPMANSQANMYGNYAGLLGAGIGGYASLGNSYASALNGYGNALGSLAQAGAASDAARYGAYSRNTSDYQGLLGALGVSALGAYGNASNAALQSQAMRDTAAFKMFGDASGANQAALAGYGGQQAAALAGTANAASSAGSGIAGARSGLGGAYANLGAAGMGSLAKMDLARTIAPALGGIFGGGGGGYSIGGPQGGIASRDGRSYGGGTAQSQRGGGSPSYGGGGVLDALTSSQSGIAGLGYGMDRDSQNAFGGISAARNNIANSGIMESLNDNFRSGWGSMVDMYQSGRQDSSNLLKDIYKGTLGMASPFLTAGREAFGATMNNLPQPYSPADKYMPTYMNGMNQFMGTQNQNITNALGAGGTAFNNTSSALNSTFGNTMNALGNGMNGGFGGGGGFGPGGTQFQLHYVNGQPEWQPTGPGFLSPGSSFAASNLGSRGYPIQQQPAPGSWNAPASMAGYANPNSSAVNKAQQWADQNAMAQRWDYYRNLPESTQMQNRYNPAAQSEMTMLSNWRNRR